MMVTVTTITFFSHGGSLGLNKFESRISLTSFHNLAWVSNEAPELCVLLSRTTPWGESLCRSRCFDRIVGRCTSHRNNTGTDTRSCPVWGGRVSRHQAVLSLRALAWCTACSSCPHLLPGLPACSIADVRMWRDSFCGGSVLDSPSPSRVWCCWFLRQFYTGTYQVKKKKKKSSMFPKMKHLMSEALVFCFLVFFVWF